MKRLFFILVTALSLASCRQWVLEDRSDCPSFLFFDITNHDRFERWNDVFLSVYRHPSNRLISEAMSTVSAIQDKEFYFTVREADAVSGYGLLGYESLKKDNETWSIPLGADCSPLFRFSYAENTQEESFIIPVEFTKEHSHITVQFVGYQNYITSGGVFPFSIVVRSNTCGLNALTGVPTRGAFEYTPQETSEARYEFNLPRQGDNQLILELFGKEGFPTGQGHLRTFNLYNILLEKGGLTWTEKNLPDVSITIDYEETTITVDVSPWEGSALNYEY